MGQTDIHSFIGLRSDLSLLEMTKLAADELREQEYPIVGFNIMEDSQRS